VISLKTSPVCVCVTKAKKYSREECFTDNQFGLITYRKYVPQTKSSKYQIQFSDEETGITYTTTSSPGGFLSIL